MLVAESGRRAGELAVLDSPAQSLRYPEMVCRIATISDACRVGDVFPVASENQGNQSSSNGRRQSWEMSSMLWAQHVGGFLQWLGDTPSQTGSSAAL
jgi:hypothetical protein